MMNPMLDTSIRMLAERAEREAMQVSDPASTALGLALIKHSLNPVRPSRGKRLPDVLGWRLLKSTVPPLLLHDVGKSKAKRTCRDVSELISNRLGIGSWAESVNRKRMQAIEAAAASSQNPYEAITAVCMEMSKSTAKLQALRLKRIKTGKAEPTPTELKTLKRLAREPLPLPKLNLNRTTRRTPTEDEPRQPLNASGSGQLAGRTDIGRGYVWDGVKKITSAKVMKPERERPPPRPKH